MLRKLFGVAVLVAMLGLVGCAQPIYNVKPTPVATTANKAVTTDDVTKAIVRAGAALGWQMDPDRPGHILGTLVLRTHVAVVDIDYDEKTYSITYKESTNLDYDGTNIHKNYNGWIQNLDNGIKVQLSNL